jgi:hypothetical protein
VGLLVARDFDLAVLASVRFVTSASVAAFDHGLAADTVVLARVLRAGELVNAVRVRVRVRTVASVITILSVGANSVVLARLGAAGQKISAFLAIV